MPMVHDPERIIRAFADPPSTLPQSCRSSPTGTSRADPLWVGRLRLVSSQSSIRTAAASEARRIDAELVGQGAVVHVVVCAI